MNDIEKQFKYCTEAATTEHLEAQLILAACYDTGSGGVSENKHTSFNWYLKAALAGDKGAQQELKTYYYNYSQTIKGNADEGAYKRFLNKVEYWETLARDNKTDPLKIKLDLSLPLIHRAAEFGELDLVRSLMEQRLAKVDIRNRHGETPLHIAAEKGQVDVLKLLAFQFDADINAKSKYNTTPLHKAAKNGHLEVVRLLVDELGAVRNDRGYLSVLIRRLLDLSPSLMSMFKLRI